MGIAIATVAYAYHTYRTRAKYRYWFTAVLIVGALGFVSVTATFALEVNFTLQAIQVTCNGMEMIMTMVVLSRAWWDKARDAMYRKTAKRLGGSFLVLCAGTATWVVGFPEIVSPGTFDVLGASHQIFHVSVIVSIVLFHLSIASFWRYLARTAIEGPGHAEGSPGSRSCATAQESVHLRSFYDPEAIARSAVARSSELTARAVFPTRGVFSQNHGENNMATATTATAAAASAFDNTDAAPATSAAAAGDTDAFVYLRLPQGDRPSSRRCGSNSDSDSDSGSGSGSGGGSEGMLPPMLPTPPQVLQLGGADAGEDRLWFHNQTYDVGD